jgi:hypothetical protein
MFWDHGPAVKIRFLEDSEAPRATQRNSQNTMARHHVANGSGIEASVSFEISSLVEATKPKYVYVSFFNTVLIFLLQT